MSQVNNLITGQWQWVALMSTATHQKEKKKSSKVTCTTTPKTADICGIVFFFYSVRGDLSYSSKKPDEEQKGCSRDLSAQKDVEWSTNKGGKCKLQLSQQPFLTITNITSLIIFNIYTDVHKIHSKRRFYFFCLGLSMHLNPLVHSEPSE